MTMTLSNYVKNIEIKNIEFYIMQMALGFFFIFFFFFKCYLPVDPERRTDLCFFSLRVNPIVGEK